MRRYYQETAEDYRRADGKSRSFRGNCLCDGRWTCSCIVRNTNTLLSRQVDEADSYSRRSCMIVTGSPKAQEWWNKRGWRVKRNVAKEEKRGENDFRKHVNKIHPIANAKNRNQARIIKFTIHRFKEKVFLQHKRNKKIDNGKKKKNPKHKSQVCDWTFSLLYHETELTCLEKPMRWLKVMKTSNLFMPICMVIWSSNYTNL